MKVCVYVCVCVCVLTLDNIVKMCEVVSVWVRWVWVRVLCVRDRERFERENILQAFEASKTGAARGKIVVTI